MFWLNKAGNVMPQRSNISSSTTVLPFFAQDPEVVSLLCFKEKKERNEWTFLKTWDLISTHLKTYCCWQVKS